MKYDEIIRQGQQDLLLRQKANYDAALKTFHARYGVKDKYPAIVEFLRPIKTWED